MELETLEVHKLALELSNEIWDIVCKWNYFERDTVGKQICKSADSISANIAEGYGRFFYKENKQFCYFSRGSLFETKDWINKMKTRNLITEEKHTELNDKLTIIGKMLNRYIKSIGKNTID